MPASPGRGGRAGGRRSVSAGALGQAAAVRGLPAPTSGGRAAGSAAVRERCGAGKAAVRGWESCGGGSGSGSGSGSAGGRGSRFVAELVAAAS